MNIFFLQKLQLLEQYKIEHDFRLKFLKKILKVKKVCVLRSIVFLFLKG